MINPRITKLTNTLGKLVAGPAIRIIVTVAALWPWLTFLPVPKNRPLDPVF